MVERGAGRWRRGGGGARGGTAETRWWWSAGRDGGDAVAVERGAGRRRRGGRERDYGRWGLRLGGRL
ncbi:hypothetical protein PAENIP36_70330 [Paenibacillus sp. P36]